MSIEIEVKAQDLYMSAEPSDIIKQQVNENLPIYYYVISKDEDGLNLISDKRHYYVFTSSDKSNDHEIYYIMNRDPDFRMVSQSGLAWYHTIHGAYFKNYPSSLTNGGATKKKAKSTKGKTKGKGKGKATKSSGKGKTKGKATKRKVLVDIGTSRPRNIGSSGMGQNLAVSNALAKTMAQGLAQSQSLGLGQSLA